ncbi:hypothetical protein DBB36_14110 [Flavobacterium sp. WLB]|nr:hypothetical protein AKO67_20885 [Flavobacterium sp. VMW]OWU90378.1 hypothetical protein APR43_12530 [Flavobacterium sp. NLM]PUU69354.1 hypothetical protein DBB36_14110 [Flavobacterium sp. WLB]
MKWQKKYSFQSQFSVTVTQNDQQCLPRLKPRAMFEKQTIKGILYKHSQRFQPLETKIGKT